MNDTTSKPSPGIGRESPTRRKVRRVVRGIGWTCLWLGVFTLGFVVHQLWITTWLAEGRQDTLTTERLEHFAQTDVDEVVVTADGEVIPIEPGEAVSPDPESLVEVEAVSLQVEQSPEEGTAFALIRVPSLERLIEGWNVVEGVSVTDLKTGAGHMPHTPLPGQPGNAVISGHRTTYGAPFHEFDQLVPGDVIEVETAVGVHVYEVRESIIVKPTDVWVTDHRDGGWLTLTTCHPKFSSRERLVVFAEMIDGPNAAAIEAIGALG